MKFCQSIFKALATKMPVYSKYTFSKPSSKTMIFSLLPITYGFWYSTNKILNDQLDVFEIDDNLLDGEIKQIQVGPKPEDTILVINHQGTIYSVQSKCSHFGFALNKGLLIGDKIICPLHNAGFSIKNGEAEQGPVFGGLKTFAVERTDGKIKVSVPKSWASKPEAKPIGKENINKNEKIVIVGAGPTGLSAAQTLRKTGYKGYIYMVTKESDGPYDRTMLSKMMDGTKMPGSVRSNEFFEDNGIILMTDTTVQSIDYDHKKVVLEGKQALGYDKLLIASGMRNRIPPIKGLNNVQYHTLRDKKDYKAINDSIRQADVKNITIIGAGFIGMEVASAIKMALKDANVTVIEGLKTPLSHVLGEKVGSTLQKLSEKNGVKVVTEAKVQQILGEGKPTEVVLNNGSLPTDVLIVATGVQCNTQFAKEVQDETGNGVKTNIFLETQKKDVYAAGDIASYPYWYTGKQARIEHYVEAIHQGSVAALNMAGKKFPMDNIPFFWTRQFNNSLSFTGVTHGWDDIHIDGNLDQMKFVAYYIRKSDNKVLGAASMGRMNQIQIINEAMKNGVMPSAEQVKNPDFKLESLISEVKKKNPKCAKCTMCV